MVGTVHLKSRVIEHDKSSQMPRTVERLESREWHAHSRDATVQHFGVTLADIRRACALELEELHARMPGRDVKLTSGEPPAAGLSPGNPAA
jgi:hypothetical protein